MSAIPEDLQQQQAALAQSLEQKRAAAREAAAERRRKLAELGPKFVDVIKIGQGFTRFTGTGEREEVFVWFNQPPGRSGVLHWEPMASEGTEQPRDVQPSRSLKFSAISDIFMGRPYGTIHQGMDRASVKLCMSFVALNTGDQQSLHLMARTKPQLEAWMYGVQHILKQGGFSFLEANEAADKKEMEIFSSYSAKQMVGLISRNAPEVSGLRLTATLNQMNRGQVFTRYVDETANGGSVTAVEVLVFFCSDGGKGTLFWGPRNQPEGFLPLRTVTDVWLGKHGALKTACPKDVESSHCVSLVSKRVTLALQAPSKAVMTQWMYGIHSLLTATPEALKAVNSTSTMGAPTQPSTSSTTQTKQEADGGQSSGSGNDSTATSATASSATDSTSASGSTNGTTAMPMASESVTSIGLNMEEDFDEGAFGQDAVDAANALEAEVDQALRKAEAERQERQRAKERAKELEREQKEHEERMKKNVVEAGNAAIEAIEAARRVREEAERAEALAKALSDGQSIEDVLGIKGEGEGNGTAGDDDDDDDDADDMDLGDYDFAYEGANNKGRRLSLFSGLQIDDDVKQALALANGTGADGDNDDDAEGRESGNGEKKEEEGEGETGPRGDDESEWTTINFDFATGGEVNTKNLPDDALTNVLQDDETGLGGLNDVDGNDPEGLGGDIGSTADETSSVGKQGETDTSAPTSSTPAPEAEVDEAESVPASRRSSNESVARVQSPAGSTASTTKSPLGSPVATPSSSATGIKRPIGSRIGTTPTTASGPTSGLKRPVSKSSSSSTASSSSSTATSTFASPPPRPKSSTTSTVAGVSSIGKRTPSSVSVSTPSNAGTPASRRPLGVTTTPSSSTPSGLRIPAASPRPSSAGSTAGTPSAASSASRIAATKRTGIATPSPAPSGLKKPSTLRVHVDSDDKTPAAPSTSTAKKSSSSARPGVAGR